MIFNRETIIALRARHEAYRIASDILYPRVEVPPPPQPAIPPIEGPLFLPRARRRATRAAIVMAIAVWAIVVIFWLVQWFSGPWKP
jgi:hypothetical protein